MTKTSGVLIAGAGHAGVECAVALRTNGFDGPITLLEQDNWLPYERPPLSKALLAGKSTVERISLKAEQIYAQHRIERVQGVQAASLDIATSSLFTLGGGAWSFRWAVIATGATARPLPGLSGLGVFSIRTIGDVMALRQSLRVGQRLIVIGGGYLGLEAACTIVGMGSEVTVLERGASIMPGRVSEHTSQRLRALHEQRGAKILTGCEFVGWEREGSQWRVTLADGTQHWGDVVLVAVGATPNTALALDAGIACDDGILVDDDCRTSAPAVFAIGDCAAGMRQELGRRCRIESVNNALVQARIVAAALTAKPRPQKLPPTFWSEQCGRRLQMAGLVDMELEIDDTIVSTARGWVVERRQRGTLRAVEAVDSPVEFVHGVKRIVASLATAASN